MHDDVVPSNRFYVTCQADEDLQSIMRYTGEDYLMVGSGYGRAGGTVNGQFGSSFHSAALSQAVVRKMTRENPAILRPHLTCVA